MIYLPFIFYLGADNHQTKEYSFVLEYADSDTLESYLSKNFYELDWNEKLRLALQLASAVECIHGCDIIHCDLVTINFYKLDHLI